jgi:hypothetical protein
VKSVPSVAKYSGLNGVDKAGETMVAKEAPTVRPVRAKEGFLMLPRALDRQTITAAIRKDRDAR